MSAAEILGQARDRANEFVVTAKPIFCNGEFGYEYDVKISDATFYRMANQIPGTSEITVPFCGSPKHLNFKLNEQVKITFFQ